jgi:hypothetical protein
MVETVRIRPTCRPTCGDHLRSVWCRLRLYGGVAARFAARRRGCLLLPRPPRRCHPSVRGCRVKAREATAQRLGLDSADSVETIESEEDEPSLEGR